MYRLAWLSIMTNILAALLTTGAGAADVTITGSQLSVLDNPNPAKRKAVFKSTDAGISAGAEDPTVSGATIELVNPTPGLLQSAVFTLPASGWLRIGNPAKGYKYKDAKLVNGPVKTAQIQNGRLIKFTAKGASMSFVLGGVPQTQIGVVIGIGTTRLCTTFGGSISKDDGVKFSAKLAPAPSACPTATVGGIVDPASAVAVTSSCLTNATGAQLGIQVTLVDTTAAPIVGATVVITSTAGLVSPVTATGNVYRAVLLGPASGASAQITVTANGTPLTAQPVIALAPPFTDATGGAGGCPQDGNLRVHVVDEFGAGIAGASVMVGASEQANAYASFFGVPANAPNTATTDALGYAVFRDFGPALSGPITITAGAPNRSYLTLSGIDASDVVLPLKQIVATGFVGTLSGDVNGIASSSNVKVGVVFGDVTMNTLASFNVTSLLADSTCYNSGVAGNIALPNNIFIPSQTIVIVGVPKKSYVSAPLPFGLRRVIALGGNIPVSALTGGNITAAISQLAFTNIAAQSFNIAGPGPTPATFNVGSFDASTGCTATGAPGTDAFCIAGLDWDGNTTPTHTVGDGALGLFNFKAGSASAGAVNLTGVSFRSKASGAPFDTVGHLGAAVSLNLDKTAASIPPGTANGISVVLKRDFPADTFPASFAYGAMYPIRVQTQTARTLTLDTPAGLGGAQYVKHTLAQEVSTPYSACAANDSTHTTLNPLWEFYAPIASASVPLPTLPAGFPRATLGGNLAGLVDPAATPDDDKIVWTSTTVREGLNGAFDYDALRLSGFQKYGTQFTTNSADYLP